MKQPPDKNVLYNLYFNQRMPMWKIAQKMKYSTQTIHKYFHFYNFVAINTQFIKGKKAWNSGKHYFNDNRIRHGKNHPRWKDKNKYYIKFKLKSKKMKENNTLCELCGNIAFLLHHRNKNTKNNSDKNLQPLCSSCHTTLHNKERGITIYKYNCEWCKKEFIVLHNRNCQQKFCSLKCKSLYQYHIKKNSPLIFYNQFQK